MDGWMDGWIKGLDGWRIEKTRGPEEREIWRSEIG